ncbi:MAG: GIN domain-containing protein [Clostridium sp.]
MYKGKVGYLVSVVFLIMFIFVGCGNSDVVDSSDGIDEWKVFISGIKKEFDTEVGEIIVRDDSSKKICIIEGNDSEKVKVNIDEENKKIFIESKKRLMNSTEKMKININVPIGYLEIENGNFKLDILEQKNDFKGLFKCGLTSNIGFSNVDDVELNIEGAGSIKLLGDVKNTNISIKGGANIDGIDFKTDKAVVRIDGIGKVSINVEDILDGNLKGVGQILYKGNPRIRKSIDGLGKIEKFKD